MPLIDESGQIDASLLLLMAETMDLGDRRINVTPAECNALLQKNWMQNKQFRVLIQGKPPTSEQVELLKALDCINMKVAPKAEYSGGFLLGTTLPSVRKRLQQLLWQWEGGSLPDFKRLYVLGSRRKLLPEKGETFEALCNPPDGWPTEQSWNEVRMAMARVNTEIEMMQVVINQTLIPDHWEVLGVDTPDALKDETKPELGMRNANTGDTFKEWSKRYCAVEESGNTLLVGSNQPFVNYQTNIARRVLGDLGFKDMKFEGTGPKANTELPFLTFLDNLAKEFYELCLIGKYI